MDSEKKMRFGDAWKIQLRAMKDIHRLDRWLLPSIALEKIVSAITPFVLIYFFKVQSVWIIIAALIIGSLLTLYKQKRGK